MKRGERGDPVYPARIRRSEGAVSKRTLEEREEGRKKATGEGGQDQNGGGGEKIESHSKCMHASARQEEDEKPGTAPLPDEREGGGIGMKDCYHKCSGEKKVG